MNASDLSASNHTPVEPGMLIKDRWRVLRSIGKGAFGEIFSADDLELNCQVGIKVERVDSKKRVLKIEVAVLKKLQPCPFVCRYYQFGRHGDFYFVVMQLLGENLSVLRKRQPGKRFAIGTTCRLGVQMLSAIESMHDFGYLHRDIKPSNFAMGLAGEAREWCFLIDFGLARRFTLPNGDIRTARDSAGFRGTARYASINSHLSKELARRDDMWSLFYLIIEFMKGSLPWSNIENKEDVGRRKLELDTPALVEGLPGEMGLFMDHLRMLEYRHRPDYDYIKSLFDQMLENAGIPEDEPYDWDKNGTWSQHPAAGHPLQEMDSKQDVARSGNPGSGIPRPRTAGRSDRARESPHEKSRDKGGLQSLDSKHLRDSERRGASASKAKHKRVGGRASSRRNNVSARDNEGSSACGLGFNEDPKPSGRFSRRGSQRSAKHHRSDEAPVDVAGLENQGSSDPARHTLVPKGIQHRNSPMSSSNYREDNEPIRNDDMVNGTSPARQHRRTDSARQRKDPDDEAGLAKEPDDEGHDSDKPPTKEGEEKGGSCRCVIS
eukprot:TRINITY_DN886_c0_g1_i2.p1 TRINITY_DN886_c0_g1~~TRINITY_DN886_c0_g1_i2.p1  ORF type:complete len:549 (-),score=126.15 TRINITY_DN886_c0_g1_i2:403-2049(-)